MRWLTWLAVNVIAVAVTVYLMSGIHFSYDSGATAPKKVLAVVVVGAIFGLVNKYVKPLTKLLSLPFIVFTLGLFLLVVNAAMLGLTAWITNHFHRLLGFTFHVGGFWSAVGGGIVIGLVAWATNLVIDEVRD